MTVSKNLKILRYFLEKNNTSDKLFQTKTDQSVIDECLHVYYIFR